MPDRDVLVTEPRPDGNRICHCFVEGGMVRFLGDSTYHLAGQTVPVPEDD